MKKLLIPYHLAPVSFIVSFPNDFILNGEFRRANDAHKDLLSRRTPFISEDWDYHTGLLYICLN